MKRRYNPLRAKLDLTQQDLAHFLQLPLSTVAMCESGKRTWPTKGLTRLALLEVGWAAAETLPADETSLVPELVEAVGQLKNRMKECLQTAGLLQKMLDSMKALFPLLKTKETTLQLLSEPGTSSIYQGWIEIQQYEIGKPLAENSPVKQIMLEHQIKTLRAEAAAAAATIETLEQQMEEEQLNVAGEKHLERRQVEEGTKTALLPAAVETTLPVLVATIETPPFDAAGEKSRKHSGQQRPKPDTVVSSGPKAFFELPGFDLCFDAAGEKSRMSSGRRRQPPGFDLYFKRNYHRTRYHRTTSTGTTPKEKMLLNQGGFLACLY